MMKDLINSKAFLILFLLAVIGALLIIVPSGKLSTNEAQALTEEKADALTAFLEQTEGVGEVHLQVCVNEEQKIISAAVICDGGNDPYVAAKVVRLLSAALGLPTNRIEVCGRKG